MTNFSQIILSKISSSLLGGRLRYPSDCEALSVDIESVSGKTVSVNTLKRIFGFLECVQRPRLSTLDILARYMGYSNWNVFIASLSKEGESGGDGTFISAEDLCQGSTVTLVFAPSSTLSLKKTSPEKFTVQKSEGTPLKEGEQVRVNSFHAGYPLRVEREGLMGNTLYLADISGLVHIRTTEAEGA